MRARDRRLLLRGVVLVTCLVPLASAADDPGITVLGTGEIMAKPDLLEIDIPVRVTLRVRFAIDDATPEKERPKLPESPARCRRPGGIDDP